MREKTQHKTAECRPLSPDAVAVGEILAILEVHSHRPSLKSFAARAFEATLPHTLAELATEERRFAGRESIIAVTTRDSRPLAPSARLQVSIDLDPLS